MYTEVSEKKPQVRARKQCSLQIDFRKFVKTRCQLKAFPHLYFYYTLVMFFIGVFLLQYDFITGSTNISYFTIQSHVLII